MTSSRFGVDSHLREAPLKEFFISLRLFLAWVFTLFGFAILAKTKSQEEMLVGAVLGACGLTFLSLLLARIKRG